MGAGESDLQAARKRKYRNVPTNGYASKREEKRANELKLLEKAGHISDLKEQVVFELIPKIGKERAVKYIADFQYQEKGKTIVEDVKGVRTPGYKIKRKLMLWRFGIEVKEI